jgi:hypothetical protein
MNTETWRPIIGFGSKYHVSDHGRVRSSSRWVTCNATGGKRLIPESILKPTPRNGYAGVTLYRDGVQVPANIHRLVAEAFIPNPLNKPEVNHKNGDKWDCIVSNLEWATRQENQAHVAHSLLLNVAHKAKHAKLTWELVDKIRSELDNGATGVSLAHKFSVKESCISRIRLGKTWRYRAATLSSPAQAGKGGTKP